MPNSNEKVNSPNQPKNSPWDSVANLAGKMGQLGGKATAFAGAVRDKAFEQLRQPALNARRKEALEFFVNNKDDIMGEPGFGTYEPEPSEQQRQLIEEFKKKSEGLWSRRFAEELCKASQSNHGLGELRGNSIPHYGDAWKFVKKYDMPMSIVLENEDFYSGMVGSPERIGDGKLSEIYQMMSQTKEGIERFREDFIDTKRYIYDLDSEIHAIISNEPYDRKKISDLKLLKQSGVCLLKDQRWGQYRDEKSVATISAGTEFLIQNNLFDGQEYERIIGDMLNNPQSAGESGFSIMDIASKAHIVPEGNSPDIKYWSQALAESGENKLKILLQGDFQKQQERLSFSDEPVMRLFSRIHMRDSYGVEQHVAYWCQNPKLQEALKEPTIQETIMNEIEKHIKAEDTQSERPPAPFLMLTSNRNILDDMKRRRIFDNYPESIKKNSTIKKVSSHDFTEKDRLELYGSKGYSDFFDDQGEPNNLWYNLVARNPSSRPSPSLLSDHEKERISLFEKMQDKALAFINQGSEAMSTSFYNNVQLRYWQFFDESGNLKPEFYQYALQEGDYAFLATQDKKETGFDDATNGFLQTYDTVFSSKIIRKAHTSKEKQEIISKYFNADGPKSEFWQTSFDTGDIAFLIKQDEDTRNKMGLDDVSGNLLTAYINAKNPKKEKSFNDFIMDASELSKEQRRQQGISEASDALLDSILNLSEESTVLHSNRSNNIVSLFDKTSGLPKPEFWQLCLDNGDFSLLAKQDRNFRARVIGFDETINTFLDQYKKIEGSKILKKAKTDDRVREAIDRYFTPNGPKPEFWQDSFAVKNFSLLARQDEETRKTMIFDEVSEAFLKAYKDLRLISSEVISNNSVEDIIKLFDTNGPKPEFWDKSFKIGDFDTASKYKLFTDASIFDEKQTAALEGYSSIEDGILRDTFRTLILKRIDDIPLEAIRCVSGAINRIYLSNSEEMSEHYRDFADAVFSNIDNVDGSEVKDIIEERIRKIEDVFIRNNLPYVGKVYRCFRLLYPIGDESHRAKKQLERGAFKGRAEAPLETDSPPRTVGEYRRIIESKDSILFGDLLKAFLGSNNRDLKQYLNGLKSGAILTERIIGGETEFTKSERETLKAYRDHLSAIYNNMQASHRQSFTETGNIVEDIRTLSQSFSPSARHNVPDRVVQSFGYMLGIRGLDDAINRMDRRVAEADARNRKAAKNGVFRLESGDIIKSIGIRYLGPSLQNGCLCKELLDGAEASDNTPLDTDVNILPPGLSGNISEGVDEKNAGAAYHKISCMVVMKGDVNSGRSRFVMESDSGEYDPNRYEIWHNGGINYGIRDAFASTDIDFIIIDRTLENSRADDLERVKYEVVKNGSYIPIVDKESGKLIFTPDEYDKMRYSLSGLNTFDGGEFLRADSKERQLVSSLSLDSYTLPDGATIEGSSEVISKSQNNKDEVDKKRTTIINEVIDPVLQQFALARKDFIDGDLTEGSAEIIDTGSTGRYSNAPGDGDFDFMMKLDRKITSDSEAMERIRRSFCDVLGMQYEDIIRNGNIRAKGVKFPSLDEPVDIDVTFNTKTNKVRYSTDVALKEFYSSMSDADREEVVANVVFAKRFLKQSEAYKPYRMNKPDSQGGLGGVGIENWILQNGGSFVAAAKGFMDVADECGDDFEAFKSRYAIIDYGENHQGEGRNDNFVEHNMTQEGYDKTRRALRAYLDQLR